MILVFTTCAVTLGLTLAQQAVDAKTNEITQVETVLRQLVLKDQVLTLDALLTQRHVAQTMVDAGGDYVMIVKDNQPQLRADIELVFMLPPVGDHQATARTVDLGHGRIEQRNLTTSAALVGYSDWPGLAQVFELGRHVMFPKTGRLLLDSRVVDVSMAYNPIVVTLSSLKPFFFNHLQSGVRFSDHGGA